jgi:2-dehydro-3-deoxygluconokinase
MGRVACLGECMIELVEQPNGTITRGFGGDTLNTALYLARLGVPTDYVTALGTDAFSDALLQAWQSEQIGTEAVLRLPGRLPGLYLIQTDATGERTFHYWRDSAPVRQLFSLPQTPSVQSALIAAELIYLSGVTLSLFDEAGRQVLFDTLAQARRRGALVAFDTNFRPRGWPDLSVARAVFEQMLRGADIVFAGVEDYLLLEGNADPVALADRLSAANVPERIIKCAEPVCRIIAENFEAFVPFTPVAHTVDTTAAGDSFAAAYLAARRVRASPEEAVQAGHRLAGIVVCHRGAIIPAAAMPALTDILEVA